jgi:arylsulfatase A-like enzyme
MNAKRPVSGKRPNIVFMLTDNLGYGEPGCYGGGILRGALVHVFLPDQVHLPVPAT